MNKIEKHLIQFRGKPLNNQQAIEAYLILDSEIMKLKGILAMMVNKLPNNEEYQIKTLSEINEDLQILRDFLRELGMNNSRSELPSEI